MRDGVICNVENGVAHVELDRPEKLNAVDAELAAGLLDTYVELDEDEDVRIVRTSGRGEAFCSGFDLSELRDDLDGMTYENFAGHMTLKENLQELSRVIVDSETIFVSRVHGFTLGVGFELAVISDISVASHDAEFGFPETEVGLSITNGVTNRLPRTVGLPRAKLLALTGEHITGREAAELGLVSDSVERDRLDERVDEIVATLQDRAEPAVSATKRLLNEGAETPYEAALQREKNVGLSLLDAEEYTDALRTFFES